MDVRRYLDNEPVIARPPSRVYRLQKLVRRNQTAFLAGVLVVLALLAGTHSEVGRIGYVAVTRAKNLLWLGVPANAIKELKPALLAAGAVVANKA